MEKQRRRNGAEKEVREEKKVSPQRGERDLIGRQFSLGVSDVDGVIFPRKHLSIPVFVQHRHAPLVNT